VGSCFITIFKAPLVETVSADRQPRNARTSRGLSELTSTGRKTRQEQIVWIRDIPLHDSWTSKLLIDSWTVFPLSKAERKGDSTHT
jgi:hypothetical protein